MVDWSMAIHDPLRAQQQGNDYVNKLFDTQAQRAAGRAVASGDYQGAATALGQRGDVGGALKLRTFQQDQTNADMDRKVQSLKARSDYSKQSLPILKQMLQAGGPEAAIQAFDQVASALEQLGATPEETAQIKKAFAANPAGMIQAFEGSPEYEFRSLGDDIVGINKATGQVVNTIKGTPSASGAPRPPPTDTYNSGGEEITREWDATANGGKGAYKEIARAPRYKPEAPGGGGPQFRDMTPEEVKARGYKPGTRVQIDTRSGREQVRQAPNDMDLRNAGFAKRAYEAGKRLDGLASKGITKPSAQTIISEANGLTRVVASNQKDRQLIQASKEWLAPILRKDTGAAVTDQEFIYYSDIYIPRIEDGPEVLAQKAEARAVAMQSMMAESGGAYADMFGAPPKPPPAGSGRIPFANAPPNQAGGGGVSRRYDAQGNRIHGVSRRYDAQGNRIQ